MRHTEARMSLYCGKVIPASVKQEVDKLVDQMKIKVEEQGKKAAQAEASRAKTLKFPPKTAQTEAIATYGRVLKINGGRDRTRTCDLLRVKRGVHSTLLIVLAA